MLHVIVTCQGFFPEKYEKSVNKNNNFRAKKQQNLLIFSDIDEAIFADSHGKLVAFFGQRAFFGRTAITHGLATFSTMVLSQTYGFLVIHGLEVPIKRPITELTVICKNDKNKCESLILD